MAYPVQRFSGDLKTGFTIAGTEYKYVLGPNGEAARCDNRIVVDPGKIPSLGTCPKPAIDITAPANSCDLEEQENLYRKRKDTFDILDAAMTSTIQLCSQAEKWAGKTDNTIDCRDPRSVPAPNLQLMFQNLLHDR
jgi:hypothetical protein